MATQGTSAIKEDWDLIIRPQRAWWDLRLGDLWKYRDLIRLMVWRDFVSVYKQTILGPLWYLIQIILTSGIYSVVFGGIANLSTDGVPPFLFYMAGNTLWGYFSACLTNTSSTFTANAGIFGKVYFPRLSVPISVVISNLISFGIRFAMFLLTLFSFMAAGAPIHLTPWVFLLPLLILLMAGLGLGLGIIVSSLTTKYRDFQHLLVVGVQLLMYASPVIYPLSTVNGNLKWLVLANPLTPILEIFKLGFLGASAIEPIMLLYSCAFVVVTLLIGILIFNHVENTFMDTV
jgi:lipopolysaccharide transport system permease protein